MTFLLKLVWAEFLLFMQPYGVNFSLKLKVHFTDVCQLLRNQNKEQKYLFDCFTQAKVGKQE